MDMVELAPILAHGLAGEFRLNEPMRRHTTWRTGGPAARAYTPRDLPDLARFLRTIPRDEPVCFVGLGSNLLVRDGGVRGTVVFLHGALNGVDLVGNADSRLVYTEAGVASPKVARFAANHGLRGAEFLTGIPGTVGGALAMNAGCYGSEIWEVVERVLTITREGELKRRHAEEYEVGYRHVELKGERREEGGGEAQSPDAHLSPSSFRLPPPASHPPIGEEFFVAAWLRFTPGDGNEARRMIKELLQRRIVTQPLEQPNAGSVFRNPPGDYAARLVESCGLKGFAIGGALVSPKHANFIVNTGAASSADVEALIEHVQRSVREHCGIQLEREVRIIGVGT